MSVSFVLHAKNSSGHQVLDVERENDGTYSFTIWGELEGKQIQIDFDDLSQRDMDDFVAFLSLRSKQPAAE